MLSTTDVPQSLADMHKMTAKQLRQKYVDLFGEQSRSNNRQWLFRRCAWRLQAMAEGGLSERARKRAKELARDVDIRLHAPKYIPPLDRPADVQKPAHNYIHLNSDDRLPMPGTRLKREYKGHIYEVEVLDRGFVYDGRVYRSLTAVARVITGSHWNGFLFFGLKNYRKEQQ